MTRMRPALPHIVLMFCGLAVASHVFEEPCRVLRVTDTTALVGWESGESATGVLVYGTTVQYGDTVVSPPASRHIIEVPSLAPATRYYYNVVYDGEPVLGDRESHFFSTAPSDYRQSMVFAVIGDTREGHESFASDHRSVIESIVAHTRPAFLLHTGDLIDASDPGGWRRFFIAESQLLSHCPLIPVRGNSDSEPSDFNARFAIPGPLSWHSISFGAVYVIGLDVGYRRPQQYYEEQIGQGSPQYGWLVDQLTGEQRRARPFTVVFLYAPLLLPDKKGEARAASVLCPLFEKYRVDLVISGGAHYFSYANHRGVTYVVSGGGGATLERPGRHTTREVRFWSSALHHLQVRVSYPAIAVSAVDNSGTAFFTRTLMATPPGQSGSADTAGSAGLVPLTVYGSSLCEECATLKSATLPQMKQALRSIPVRINFVDTDSADNLSRYASLESSLGKRRHGFPVVLVGSGLYSGSDLNAATLADAVRREWSDAGEGAPGIDGRTILAIALAGVMLGGIVLVTLLVRRRAT